jgi:Fur family transcriptional regulator, ferric uptake regulator
MILLIGVVIMSTLTNIEQELNKKGHRLTPHRETILSLFCNHKDEHLSGEDVYEILQSKGSSIGKATVYRTLLLFENLEILNKISFEDGFTRYELNNPDEQHLHHHLICINCDKVSEVKTDMLEEFEAQVYSEIGFTVKKHVIKLYGYCNKCSN